MSIKQLEKPIEHLINANVQRTQIIKLVRQWGGCTTDAVLDPETEIFTVPTIKGLIGYRIKSHYALIFGDPVCSPTNRKQLLELFNAHLKKINIQPIYISISQAVAEMLPKHSLIEFGYELILDPHLDPRKGSGERASLVRRKVRHAVREGALINEYTGKDRELEQALEEVGQTWLQSRKGPQIHISKIRLFEDRLGKRWFYAHQDERIVAVLTLNQLEQKNGWLLNHLMIAPEAPNGISELLLVSTLAVLNEEECHYVTVGSVPSQELGAIEGLGPFSTWIARKAFRGIKWIYQLDGRYKFWEKFQPQRQSTYVLFDNNHITPAKIITLLKLLA